MTATSQPAGHPAALARRLKSLRKERSLPQRTVADALRVSIAAVSAWESETNPTVPADGRIRDLAVFYAVDPARTQGRLLPDVELTPEERETRDGLLAEWRGLLAPPLPRPSVAPWPTSSFAFPPGQDIRIVCGRLDLDNNPGHPYTNRDDLNYTDLLTFADADALVELFGFLRKINPDNDVRFLRSDRLLETADSADHLASHLILLGGVGLNVTTTLLPELTALPIKQESHPDFADRGEVFEVTAGSQKGKKFLPTVVADGLIEDVGMFARTPNPFHSGRTLTVCNGVFSRGVLGAVRMLTDDKLRRQNEEYLADRFGFTDRFAVLVRVRMMLAAVQTPDLQNSHTRLFEWSADEKPDDSHARERTG
jgi:transcriptional regulator with XRE-family HTH domain